MSRALLVMIETLGTTLVAMAAVLGGVLLLAGCTTVHTEEHVTVDRARVYVVATPDAAAALVCWLDEPLSRCAAVREEEAR